MKCKHCGEYAGEYYSELEIHLWNKHRKVMMQFLESQREPKERELKQP